MEQVKRAIYLGLMIVNLGILSGCSGSKVVPVKGTVVLPDDIKLGVSDSVSLTFYPNPPDEKVLTGSGRAAPKMINDPKMMDSPGVPEPFVVTAGTNKGLTPGSYKVTAKVDKYGQFTAGKSNRPPGMESDGTPEGDFNAKYSHIKDTPLTITITPETKNLVVDFKEGKITSSK